AAEHSVSVPERRRWLQPEEIQHWEPSWDRLLFLPDGQTGSRVSSSWLFQPEAAHTAVQNPSYAAYGSLLRLFLVSCSSLLSRRILNFWRLTIKALLNNRRTVPVINTTPNHNEAGQLTGVPIIKSSTIGWLL